jgi:L-aspartate oxidase
VTRRTDFLIIGSGIAGLRAAVHLASIGDVVLLTKANPEESNTGYAQGGIAAAVGGDDSPDLHFTDTMAAGDGLCATDAVRVLVTEGPRYVRELIAWGARVDRDDRGAIALAREAAHSVRRVLHADDATGRELSRALWARAMRLSRLEVHNHAQATQLIVEDGGCVGARYLVAGENGAASLAEVRARSVLLATGGAGQVFSDTTNPIVASGDGVALAWRAGARVCDMEFVQFHPTALAVPGYPRTLLSEALRGEGARLLNHAGEPFTTRYDPAGDLAPRDRVARAIVMERRRTGQPVYLSLAHLDAGFVLHRFPTAAEACQAAGLDLARDLIPVGPAAHYVMGGVETDLWGRTSLPGLLAAGEVACTGVHGANRLASNSLLEGLVFGARAASVMDEAPAAGALGGPTREWTGPDSAPADPAPVACSEEAVRSLMWADVGLLRAGEGLARAVATLRAFDAALAASLAESADPAHWRLANLVTVGCLMARAALRRTESRGGHYRSDFPSRDDVHWSDHITERSRYDL